MKIFLLFFNVLIPSKATSQLYFPGNILIKSLLKRFILAVPVFLLLSCGKKESATVLVLPTIQASHEHNSNYNYKILFEVIREFDPHVIGLEIRPEDISQDKEYLELFYTGEMIMVRDSFPDKVVGIDYYGKSFEDQLLPKDVFKDSTNVLGKFVLLEQRMNTDTLVQRKKKELGMPEILEEQKRIARIYSPQQLMNGEYDSLTKRYYTLLEKFLNTAEYEEYIEFNKLRNERITKNSIDLIKDYSGKRILLLVGANHRPDIVEAVNDLKRVKHQVALSDPRMKKKINKEAPAVEKQQIFIDAPVEVVWEVLTEINSWPEWQEKVQKAELTGKVEEGAKFEYRSGGINFKSQIHTYDPYTSFGWTGKTMGASAVHNWNFMEEKEGTVVSVEESIEGLYPSLLKKKFRNELQAGMEMNLQELKKESEKRNNS
ncbi:SRPBCC family protein [Antarcticibacterium sp. 1MA-6-2]|uniref:SRPBCC family protein n=1 Tax=Antarcticibacterium sp. 1MA-6-2 TaxID=2908210 RepID=UPI001F1FA8FB|nr:SRPBCC family protein [Antarcticibacterium sp. 1MA-6-2]UJH91208.1 SRPBCC family protein [Antarcticibacterium sp. 1MA-6-2]